MSKDIIKLWSQQPGDWFFLSTKSSAGKWRDHAFARDDIRNIRDFIRKNMDKDVYFCPHGFVEARRKEECAAPIKCLWADLDEADPRKLPIKPSLAIESSPGRYAGVWLLDDILKDKELNRKLTYFSGADKGGWGLTKVLRVPGTRNYKYKAQPMVEVMWSSLEDGYQESKLVRAVGEATDVGDVISKYERLLKPSTIRELMAGTPQQGKRSEVLWRLENELADVGMTRDEIILCIKHSPWNKHRGRHNEDQQIGREVDKILLQRQYAKTEAGKFLQKSLAEVQEEKIDWLWYPFFARGELTIVEGDPGVGKSYMVQMVAKALCDGDRLPDASKLRLNGSKSYKIQYGYAKGEPGPVVYFDMENNAATVTKKRMRNNGLINYNRFYQEEEPFSIDNVRVFEQICEAIGKLSPSLIVFDTINTYIGRADTHNAAETQQAFAQFKTLARRFNCAVIAIRHLTKGSRDKAIYRGQGSIAFTGMARVVLSVGVSPTDPSERIAAVTKLNVARQPPALVFSIDSLPDTLDDQDRSRFRWHEWCSITSDELLEAKMDKRTSEAALDAEAYVLEKLSSGDVGADELHRDAEARGISARTLRRVLAKLGAQSVRKGFGGKRMWRLRGASVSAMSPNLSRNGDTIQ